MKKLTIKEVVEILKLHTMWKNKEEGGKQADFSKCCFEGLDLIGMDFSGVNCYSADFSGANCYFANFGGAYCAFANFSKAYCYSANFSGANCCSANFSEAYCYSANFTDTHLVNTILTNAILTNTIGILNPIDWMNANFEKDELGYIVYKGFGNTTYPIPEYWKVESSSYIEEDVNENRSIECGCGVNFATKEWIVRHYPNSTIWKCRLEFNDLDKLVVFYNADGKARCGRLFLIVEDD
jgi:hypothetical protein